MITNLYIYIYIYIYHRICNVYIHMYVCVRVCVYNIKTKINILLLAQHSVLFVMC